MPSAGVFIALRTFLLADAGVSGLVAQRIYPKRSDIAGAAPAATLELAGGPGAMNTAMEELDVRVGAYSADSWEESFAVLDAIEKRLYGANFLDGLTAPVLSVTRCDAPVQAAEGDYYHSQQTFSVIARVS